MPVILQWRGALLGSSHNLLISRLSALDLFISLGLWAEESPRNSHCMCRVFLKDSAVCSTDSNRWQCIVLHQSFFPTFIKKDGEGDGGNGKIVDQGSFLLPELYNNRAAEG